MLTFAHDYEIDASVEDAWRVLSDISTLVPCLPGAELTEVAGPAFTGQVKVKVGPMQIRYHGEGHILECDPARQVMTIAAKGTETAGTGTASVTVSARLEPSTASTCRMTVTSEFEVTGTPARFGGGALNQVAERILSRFATNLVIAVNRSSPAHTAGVMTMVEDPGHVAGDLVGELSVLDLMPQTWRRTAAYAACFAGGLGCAVMLGRCLGARRSILR